MKEENTRNERKKQEKKILVVDEVTIRVGILSSRVYLANHHF